MFLCKSLLLVSLFLLPLQAQAHKIHVFAWVSGDTVTVESSFSQNRPVIDAHVSVKNNTSGSVVLEGTSDKNGLFTFAVPAMKKTAKNALLIVVSGSEGHQSEWLIPATEFLSEKALPAPGHSPSVSSPELQQMLGKLLDQKLAPIKRSLAQNRQDRPGFRDIIGGIGYLLGLAGLITWLKNRPRKGCKTDDK